MTTHVETIISEHFGDKRVEKETARSRLVTWGDVTAVYRLHEIELVRRMRAQGASEHELAIIHLLKGYFDAVVADEDEWRRKPPSWMNDAPVTAESD